jgi:hypothetical protein
VADKPNEQRAERKGSPKINTAERIPIPKLHSHK